MAQKKTRGITPGHHLLLHLKSPRIRYPKGATDPVRDITVAGPTNTLIPGRFRLLRTCADAPRRSRNPTKAGSAGKQRENKPLRDCQTGNGRAVLPLPIEGRLTVSSAVFR